jgi:hypothetical protein
MSSLNWIGGAPAIAQVTMLTVSGTVASTYTYTITIGGASVEYTAGGSDSATTVAAALVALCSATSAAPQFAEATWANVDGVITMTQQAAGAGQPITVSCAATGSGSSFVAATTTASSGPNWWSVAANWSTGAVPASGDDVTITAAGANIFYGLAQSAVTLDSLTINSKTVQIGNSPINAGGYPEYRPLYLAIGADTINVQQASGRVKIDTGSAPTAATVVATAVGVDQSAGVPSLLLLGTNAGNSLYVLGGSIGIAFFGGETAEFGALAQTGGSILAGGGAELVAVDNAGGALSFSPNGETTSLRLDAAAGTVTCVTGSASGIGTVDVYGGTLDYQDGGTITQLTVGQKGTASFVDNIQDRTITNCTLGVGASLIDSSATITFTNPLLLEACRVDDVSLDFGFGRHLQVS